MYTPPPADQPYAPEMPPLSPRAELALLGRALDRIGYHDRIAGHLTYRQDDGTLLTNPVRLRWDELRAGDIMHIDLDGNVLDGPWTITPAIEMHLALHRARDDIRVAVHNHPKWATIWGDLHRVPPAYDQTSALAVGEIALYDEYDGTFVDEVNAKTAVEALGDARMALLANHGVLVVAPSVDLAYHRCHALEWRAEMAWHVEVIGGGVPLKPDVAEAVGLRFDERPMIGLWESAARREIDADPSVLDETHRRTVIDPA
jgi:ribulose-5-phosphate 4-epimerase/fuculose-1-phosphate aldolase